MSSSLTYSGTELSSYNLPELTAACVKSAYTPMSVSVDQAKVGTSDAAVGIVIAEDSIDASTLKAAIEAEMPLPTLSPSATLVQCVGDGVATANVTISDSRGAGASGKTCKMRFVTHMTGLVAMSASAVFDGAGDAVFTLGPTPAAGMCCSEFLVEFYVDGEAWVLPTHVHFGFTG